MKVHLYDIILGGQDGLVNVLALVMGVAEATTSTRIILIAGIVGAFAEAFSMGAVAYTSGRTQKLQIEKLPKKSKKQCAIVSEEFENPSFDSLVVGLSSLIAAFVPILPFFLVPVQSAITYALILSIATLFTAGYIRGKIIKYNPVKSGLEIMFVGMGAALVGYLVGKVVK